MDYNKKAIALHKKHRGKISIASKVTLKTKDDLSAVYTPGVGAVCMEIAREKKKSWELTNRANQVAIVSDGTAILGLGDIGPEAGMPVMEGKSAIFKEFAGVDAFPLCINTTDSEEIIMFCKQIEPSFGGINLEDISAPRCFYILERLEKELNIPVFHDDQDGTAIVTLAGLINACRVSGKVLKELRIVISGAGAAGIAIARLLLAFGVKDLLLLDSKGVVSGKRIDLNKYKKALIAKTANKNFSGTKEDALVNADVYIGVSKPKELTKEMVGTMNAKPIIFAMANPVPEIFPEEAFSGGAGIVATGRSDYDNQINNALVFPGIFRGLLDSRIKKVTTEMKISVAIALAYTVKKPTKNKIIPNITDKNVVKVIAKAIMAKA
ncbi:MAG: Malate dehydrogenase (Oxaloacetate decarboxylating) [Candidatus Falkowbacteria bacterium GW2011_GWC2_38_22]|uniref:Malate dehydrogenase (Oxaloacetate decarboxylating) n=1 Tax=Candidatus Falkowbacteria bacterium GW2011_GWE1_38_31 TaxID=1618638 RepID=A0A0G0N1C1_9BACT|nr:MAG: Malate dehydrogenase (Oxaloacetate decarboxylating) [Candidatus Falkowbacteria bacterium GW2011_GWF2_38_1205]KKQ62091.1 MAG: Malate dehydrogenase (Oxaloacetate decarboxylating) [Candidatus Falkowbacteria bacterium GW2011_GWC2_38_22]KKQ64241.1 MAG: Malate dehydrogenase (Oxaloacetate decarboxylating) [Candidatus Falkowbacteria bacterium GW2011_GWF1_38_22]KKQ66218.1 MAG: Malate dehydrogenase (Oxaloacetate decarboxylating) [Candidatus Falkowbacteria bacterium GW2011_GWE2_38_254]KKQ70946.1 M